MLQVFPFHLFLSHCFYLLLCKRMISDSPRVLADLRKTSILLQFGLFLWVFLTVLPGFHINKLLLLNVQECVFFHKKKELEVLKLAESIWQENARKCWQELIFVTREAAGGDASHRTLTLLRVPSQGPHAEHMPTWWVATRTANIPPMTL